VVSPNDLSAIPAVTKRRFEEWLSGDWERGPIPGEIQTNRSYVAEIAEVLNEAITDPAET
jgi:hypothetical protein